MSSDGEAPRKRMRAQDQEQQAHTSGNSGPHPGVMTRSMTHMTGSVAAPSELKSLKLPIYQAHIGSLVLKACDYLKISPDGIFFKLNFGSVQVDMQIFPKEIENVTCCLGTHDVPALILQNSPECGQRLCKMFQLEKTGPYFDPEGRDDKVKKISFVLRKISMNMVNANRMVTEAFAALQRLDSEAGDPPWLHLVSELEMETLLIKYGVLVRKIKPIKLPRLRGADLQSEGTPPSKEHEERRTCSPFVGREPTKLFTYPPPPATGGIVVTNKDYFCLNDGEFLNDVIIDFYIKYFYLNKLSEDNKAKTHIFSSFFYSRLTQSIKSTDELKLLPSETRHSRVKTWTRHVDIFDKDFIIIPINETCNWYLAVICWPGMKEPVRVQQQVTQDMLGTSLTPEEGRPHRLEDEDHSQDNLGEAALGMKREEDDVACEVSEAASKGKNNRTTSAEVVRQACILIFDSLSGGAKSSVINVLREYLEEEWKSKKADTEGPRVFDVENLPGCSVSCPQQINFGDGGVYVLQYVESFFENPLASYAFPIHLEHWFKDEVIYKKREELKNLILELKRQLNPS